MFRYRTQRTEVNLKDLDVALITAKTLSVQRCTLHALIGRHLFYLAEEAEPGRGAQLGFFFKIATETTAPAAESYYRIVGL